MGIDIPGFIRLIREGNTPGALKKIKEQNPLPSVCGRICPAPCETVCVLTKDDATIGIRALERFAADNGKERSFFSKQKICAGKRIAVIGSGPAGLASAALLAAKDYQVTVFEAMEKCGGTLRTARVRPRQRLVGQRRVLVAPVAPVEPGEPEEGVR